MTTTTTPSTTAAPTPTTSCNSLAYLTRASSYFDLALTLLLHTWEPLTLAVTSQWGGPTSADKRDWLAGVLSDLFTTRPSTDAEDIEAVVLQVMQDEFDVRLEDESEERLAMDILAWRRVCYEEGEEGWRRVEEMRGRWEERERRRGGKAGIQRGVGQGEEEWESGESSDEGDDEEEGGVEVEMTDAPAVKEKVEPEVDEEGFTKVVGKRR